MVDNSIDIFIDILVDISIDIFIDILTDIFIDISIDILVDISIDVLTDKEEGGTKEGVDFSLQSNNPTPTGGELLRLVHLLENNFVSPFF